MPVLIQVNFPYPATGPWGEAQTEAYRNTALAIAQKPGYVWKVWIDSQERGEAGGIYLFHRPSAEAYVAWLTDLLKSSGTPEVHAKLFDVNEQLSAIGLATLTSAPLPA